MAFNPREALERIRQNKAATTVPTHRPLDEPSIDSSPPLLFDDSKISDVRERIPVQGEVPTVISELSRKVENLERVTRDLARDLADSNHQIERLRREKSELETNILKLEYENNQLKNSSKASALLRDIKLKRETPDREEKDQKGVDRSPKLLTPAPANGHSSNVKLSVGSSRAQPNLMNVAVPEEVLQPVLKESIDSLLHRKERNFKVLKNSASARQQLMAAGNNHLSQLATIMKQYPEMERPVIVIALEEADFQ